METAREGYPLSCSISALSHDENIRLSARNMCTLSAHGWPVIRLLDIRVHAFTGSPGRSNANTLRLPSARTVGSIEARTQGSPLPPVYKDRKVAFGIPSAIYTSHPTASQSLPKPTMSSTFNPLNLRLRYICPSYHTADITHQQISDFLAKVKVHTLKGSLNPRQLRTR